MSRSCITQRVLVSGLGSIIALSLIGCGPQFDPSSKLQSLRILAVKKDDPYLRPAPVTPGDVSESTVTSSEQVTAEYEPGYTAHLTAAIEDGRLPEDRQGPLQKLWFAGCNNPPRDNYFSCMLNVWLTFKVWSELGPYSSRGPGKLPDGEGWPNATDRQEIGDLRFVEYFSSLFPDLAARVSSGSPEQMGELSAFFEQVNALRIGVGDTFDYTVPSWVIDRHPPPEDADLPQYGLSQVFFAVCDGEIGISPAWETVEDPLAVLTDATRGFPITCYERGTKKERGPDHFMVSYSNLYVYEELKNRNPVIEGLQLDDQVADSSALCIGQACDSMPPRVCIPGVSKPSVKHCDPNAVRGCGEHLINPKIIKTSNSEFDDNASRAGGGNAKLLEQLWIRYYADEGEIDREVKRLQDAKEGWFEGYQTKWTPPTQANTVAHVWAVVYDNRGGVDWVRVSVCVE